MAQTSNSQVDFAQCHCVPYIPLLGSCAAFESHLPEQALSKVFNTLIFHTAGLKSVPLRSWLPFISLQFYSTNMLMFSEREEFPKSCLMWAACTVRHHLALPVELSRQFVTNPHVLQEKETGLRDAEVPSLGAVKGICTWELCHGWVALQLVGDSGAKFRVIHSVSPCLLG